MIRFLIVSLALLVPAGCVTEPVVVEYEAICVEDPDTGVWNCILCPVSVDGEPVDEGCKVAQLPGVIP